MPCDFLLRHALHSEQPETWQSEKQAVMKCIRPLASRGNNYSSHSTTQHQTNNKSTAMLIIKRIGKLATRPARLGSVTTPAPDDPTASSSGPANDQTAEELASSSKVHQPMTTADSLESARQEREGLRNIIDTSTDPEQVRICQSKLKGVLLKIRELKAVEKEKRTVSTAANESDKQDVGKNRQTSDARSVRQRSGLKEGKTSNEGEGDDDEGGDDGDPPSNQTSGGPALSSKGQQPTTGLSNLRKAESERVIVRETIGTLNNTKKDRPLDKGEREQLKMCKETLERLQLKIEELTGVTQERDEDDGDGDESDSGPSTSEGGDNNEQPSAGSGVQAAQQTQPPPAKQSSTVGRKKGQGKGKRTGHGWTRKKRYQPHTGPPGMHSDNYTFYRDRYYKIQGIMAETKAKYHIRWAGKDSAGGNYVDTWVPKGHANKRAVTDWRKRVEAGDEDMFYPSEVEK
jgi:hypothetical protein